MASLKSLLNSAIKAGCGFAYSDAKGKVSITPVYDSWSRWYTPPNDGWVVVCSWGTGELYLDQVDGTGVRTWVLPGSNTAQSIPVKKGYPVSIYIPSGNTKVELYFVPAGGRL